MAVCCCKELELHPGCESPFSKVVALGYYDGPTSGAVVCSVCLKAYKFELLNETASDWYSEDGIRVFGLAPFSIPSSFERLVATGSKEGLPHWPIWVPRMNQQGKSDIEVLLEG